MTVELGHNTVLDYQKTGIVANGDVDVWVHHSDIGASATQENLAANSIQLGFGATGVVEQNAIDGNQWMGTSNYVATAVLVYLANGVDLSKNNIRGNSEIGVYFYGDDGFVDNNKIFDEGPDHPNASYDIGLGDWGLNNTVTNNKVRGFETPYDIADLGTNKVVSGS